MPPPRMTTLTPLPALGAMESVGIFPARGRAEAQRLHGEERGAVSASLTYTEQEITPGYRHGISPRSAEMEWLLCLIGGEFGSTVSWSRSNAAGEGCGLGVGKKGNHLIVTNTQILYLLL